VKSIRTALIVKVGCTTLVLALAAGLGLYLYVRSALLGHFDNSLTAKALAVGTQMKREIDGRLEFEFSPETMPEFGASRNPEYFHIRLLDGTTIARSATMNDQDLPTGPQPDRSSAIWDMRLRDGRAGRAVRLKLRPGDETDEVDTQHRLPGLRVPMGTMVNVVVATSREPLDQTLDVLLTSLALAAGVLGLGIVVSLSWTVGWGLSPLRQLAAQASEISARSLGKRFGASAMPEELRPICDRLNDLLQRLEAAFLRERRFTADVAHELRTPIAELRTLAEVSARWPDDLRSAQERWREVVDIAVQMEGIVAVLLSLARCEDGRQAINLEAVDLRACALAAWQPVSKRARARGMTVDEDELPEAQAMTDKALFLSVLGNIFANAVDHAPADGKVSIRGESQEDSYTLVVGNTNRTLAHADLEHLFEPFWRKDEARRGSNHSGLGLALVAAYARLLGVEVAASLPAADWFEIRLSIPAAHVAVGARARPALMVDR
jgi:signal transduction histidine kinase